MNQSVSPAAREASIAEGHQRGFFRISNNAPFSASVLAAEEEASLKTMSMGNVTANQGWN